jgi:hypothetical protein
MKLFIFCRCLPIASIPSTDAVIDSCDLPLISWLRQSERMEPFPSAGDVYSFKAWSLCSQSFSLCRSWHIMRRNRSFEQSFLAYYGKKGCDRDRLCLSPSEHRNELSPPEDRLFGGQTLNCSEHRLCLSSVPITSRSRCLCK